MRIDSFFYSLVSYLFFYFLRSFIFFFRFVCFILVYPVHLLLLLFPSLYVTFVFTSARSASIETTLFCNYSVNLSPRSLRFSIFFFLLFMILRFWEIGRRVVALCVSLDSCLLSCLCNCAESGKEISAPRRREFLFNRFPDGNVYWYISRYIMRLDNVWM